MLTADQLTAIDRHLRKENWLLNEDLIVELTDHYAAGIDERIARGLDLNTAIRDIHRDFGGRRGLLKMEEDFQKSQEQHNGRIVRELFISYFRLPRFTITLLTISTIYCLIRFTPAVNILLRWDNHWSLVGLLGGLFIAYMLSYSQLINGSYQRAVDKSFSQAIRLVVQSLNSIFLLGFYSSMFLPLQKLIPDYPLPTALIITLLLVVELSATELLVDHIYKKKSVKPA